MRKFVYLFFYCFLSCLLASCATLPAKSNAFNQQLSWPQRQKQLAAIHQWQLNGAIAIKTPQQGQTASLSWQQQSLVNYHISLYGPLGAGRVTLAGTNQGVQLQANDKLYHAKSPEALMQEMLGWQLPVGNLYYWVRGLPAPGLQARLHFDTFHHLSQLQQQGWTVHYLRYTGVGDDDLPSLLTLQRLDLTVKIVISQWVV